MHTYLPYALKIGLCAEWFDLCHSCSVPVSYDKCCNSLIPLLIFTHFFLIAERKKKEIEKEEKETLDRYIRHGEKEGAIKSNGLGIFDYQLISITGGIDTFVKILKSPLEHEESVGAEPFNLTFSEMHAMYMAITHYLTAKQLPDEKKMVVRVKPTNLTKMLYVLLDSSNSDQAFDPDLKQTVNTESKYKYVYPTRNQKTMLITIKQVINADDRVTYNYNIQHKIGAVDQPVMLLTPDEIYGFQLSLRDVLKTYLNGSDHNLFITRTDVDPHTKITSRLISKLENKVIDID
jgi:hypothetical protein